jgi:gliding motility-associated lipoprotein GldD
MVFFRILSVLGVFMFVFSGCEDYVPVPKPRAYPRVVYPEKAYRTFNESNCQFTFEMPQYAQIEQDSTFFDGRPESDCWFNINVPTLNAQIHCSYYPVTNRARLDELVQDAFTMAQKHNIKANYIEEIPVHRTADRVHGIIFAIEGATASSYQFFVTDSTTNFLRGALYFNTPSRPDSIAPVLDFMRQDINKMVETLRWGN